jgi:hypothetical protein
VVCGFGHAFDIGAGSMVVAEGNLFQNVVTPLLENEGQLFSSPSTSANAACEAYLGHVCQLNAFGSSGSFEGSDTSFFSDFSGKTIASASPASSSMAIRLELGNFGTEQFFALKSHKFYFFTIIGFLVNINSVDGNCAAAIPIIIFICKLYPLPKTSLT